MNKAGVTALERSMQSIKTRFASWRLKRNALSCYKTPTMNNCYRNSSTFASRST
ncbi:hypothetical protein DPMN_154050 [Dreissena polymorpha]|uniref:Uncharacterized protein n=1 Tax=Dreissena polymorpha TaxID=45954 RepID=A0A9D4FR18_DREPO|nr:hypothetical protein DPMN_154050 [Dreissena polymorpha]